MSDDQYAYLKKIKPGMKCVVNPRTKSEMKDVFGTIICRRRGIIRFKPDENQQHSLDVYAEQWNRNVFWEYKINLLDIVSIDGKPFKEFFGV